jgi:four helix bundle protein
MKFKFEDLKVWQKALDLTLEIDQLTRKFPKEELYILTSQIKRAADSIALNIAEGSTGQTNPEFKRFLSFSIRSGIEVVGCLHIGKRRGIVSDEDFIRLIEITTEIIKMLNGLKNSLK